MRDMENDLLDYTIQARGRFGGVNSWDETYDYIIRSHIKKYFNSVGFKW